MEVVRKKFDSMYIGVIVGLFAPAIPFFAYYWVNYYFMSIEGFFRLLELANTYTPLISLCVLANLVAFFAFIWKHRYYSSRGVLLSTFLYAILIFIIKLSQ